MHQAIAVLIFIFLFPFTSYGLPAGVIKLQPERLFFTGEFYCGFVASRWVPGRLVNARLFYGMNEERKYYLTLAKSAQGRKKIKYTKKAQDLLRAYKKNLLVCAKGPTFLYTPTPSPTFTQVFIADTPSLTATPTCTFTPTPLITPTMTSTQTPTYTATLIPPTMTPSSTATPTCTLTSTPSITPTLTATQTPTFTATSIPPTITPSPTVTRTPTSTPTSTRTPTVTSTPTRTATPTPTSIPLQSINSSTYYTEHAVFIIPDSSQVTWTGSSSWESVYSSSNIDSYVATLKSAFPDDYFFVVVTANNLLPSRVPSVLTLRHIANGIGQDSITGVNIPNICRYHISGSINNGAYGVLDHEIGHNWGAFLGSQLGTGHWLSNSTVNGQMKDNYTDDGYQTVKQITGDLDGFYWNSINNLTRNETETFSDADLYLQGLSSIFPDTYVLNSPTYNSDITMSYASVNKYDHAWMVSNFGVRSPSYQTSEKRLRIGFVYIARDYSEILNTYQPIERSIRSFVDGETIDTTNFRYQVPFLVETKYRGSVNARLADLDGNSAPTITISGSSYVTTTSGSATVSYTASDPDGINPVVSCVPSSSDCVVSGNNVTVSNLTPGTHFFTIKAQDSGGKKVFAHFVIDAS